MEGESHAYNIDLVKERVPNTAFISVLLIIGICGNSTCIFFRRRVSSYYYENTFYAALPIIDLIGVITGSVLGILKNTYVVTFKSDFACRTLWYISSCSALLSLLVIMMISIEKYLRIRPFSRYLTTKSRSIAVLLLSCLVCVITIPVFLLNGKSALTLNREFITATNATAFLTDEIDVKSFLPTNLTTSSSLDDTENAIFSTKDISDMSRFSPSNTTFVTAFSCCELDSENQNLRVLKVVYGLTVLVTVIVSLLTIIYAYTNILKMMLRTGRRIIGKRRVLRKMYLTAYSDNAKPLFKKKNSINIDFSIHHTGLHCADGQWEISESSDECAYNIPIKAISQKGRFMSKPETNLCMCCLPSLKPKGRDPNPVQTILKNFITVITLMVMSYMPSVISMLFQDHHSDTSSFNVSAFRLNLNLIVSRSYLLAHALNPYVTIYFVNNFRRRLVQFMSQHCTD